MKQKVCTLKTKLNCSNICNLTNSDVWAAHPAERVPAHPLHVQLQHRLCYLHQVRLLPQFWIRIFWRVGSWYRFGRPTRFNHIEIPICFPICLIYTDQSHNKMRIITQIFWFLNLVLWLPSFNQFSLYIWLIHWFIHSFINSIIHYWLIV